MRLLGAVAALLVLAACGTTQPGVGGASETHLRVASAPHSGPGHLASLAGVLHGRANPDGTACFWIRVPAKPGAQAGRIALMWPKGSFADVHPLRVVDGAGHVLGRTGHRVTLAGGFLDRADLPLPGCPDFREAFG